MNVWLEVIGWVGSILVVLSLMQARVLRFRWMNFVGALIATVYNAWIGIWPFAAMNAAITIIDAYWLRRLYRDAHDTNAYAVVEVSPNDGYLQHLLATHAADIASFHPSFTARAEDRTAFLVVRGDETVGAVLLRDAGAGEGLVDLDWVTPRFRDFTPGEFVHRSSGIFRALGFTHVVVPDATPASHAYLERVGFVRDGATTRWVRTV